MKKKNSKAKAPSAALLTPAATPPTETPAAASTPTETASQDEGDDDDDEVGDDELITPHVRSKLATLQGLARREVRRGPGLCGWDHNESKRADVEGWARFLDRLIASLPPEEAAEAAEPHQPQA